MLTPFEKLFAVFLLWILALIGAVFVAIFAPWPFTLAYMLLLLTAFYFGGRAIIRCNTPPPGGVGVRKLREEIRASLHSKEP